MTIMMLTLLCSVGCLVRDAMLQVAGDLIQVCKRWQVAGGQGGNASRGIDAVRFARSTLAFTKEAARSIELA